MSLNSKAYSPSYSLESMFSMQHHTVLVTGAAGQLGGEITRMLLACGAKVIAADVKQEDLDARHIGHKSLFKIACDIRSEEAVTHVFDASRKAGFIPTSVVNNAGVSVFEDFEDRKEENFDFVMDVNLKGTFWLMKHFIAHNKAHKSTRSGRIVNIASHYGIISPDFRIYEKGDRKNSEVYGATKAGVIQMTKYFAANCAQDNLRVNAVAPGGVSNPWTPQAEKFKEKYSERCPMGRMAEIHEIVGGVCFLLSDAAEYVNGHTLVIDGGMTAW